MIRILTVSLAVLLAPIPAAANCEWDCVNNDRWIAIDEFLGVLGTWGEFGVPCDVDGGGVGISDFLGVLGNWGLCDPEPICPDGNGDSCSTAILAVDGTYFGSTLDNSGASDDTSCAFGDTIDEWYCYTATCDGGASATTCNPGTFFDTTLAVFDECNGQELACDDDTEPKLCSTVTWTAVAGETYLIRLSGWSGGFGSFELTIGCGCVNPSCPGTGNCCFNNGTPGCTDCGCCDLVCSLDPFCCEVSWDSNCAILAAQNCSLCGG